jgi:S-DNA-T family DNA segregation ATPase FtsK/SpoIIIE
VLAFLLLTAALYLCLALLSLSVDPEDPNAHGGNWVGPVGAAMAGVFAQGFGVVAWALPIEMLAFSLPLLKERKISLTGLRAAGDLVVVIVSSALVHVLLPNARVFGELRAGGNVGLLFGELFEALFSTAGSILVSGAIVGLILISRASFSFIESCRRAADMARRVWNRLVYWAHRAVDAWSQARVARAEQHQREQASARPRIALRLSDQAIIAQLDDEDRWIPLEKTGEPPLAIAESLRRAWTELTETAPEQPQEAVPREAAPKSFKKREPTAKAIEAALSDVAVAEPPDLELASPPESPAEADGPLKIVDTRSNTAVERSFVPPKTSKKRGFQLPDTSLLDLPSDEVVKIDEARVFELAQRLEKTLIDYGVIGKVEEVHPGPTVTTYEYSPQAGTKVSKIAGLCDDLALGLSRKVRIIAPIPGKGRIGFELPNDERVPVNLRELIEDSRFEKLASKAPLPVVLGRDIVGAPFYADLASMPHVIVAGATGAGKSVGLNVMLSSLLFKRTPDELRMLMIDPKVVELAPFDGIPHMLLPVVTDMKQATKALKWAVDEMERRYQAFGVAGTKNITTYNQWADKVARGEAKAASQDVEAIAADGSSVTVSAAKSGSDGLQLPGRMPHIVIVVDEFADLIMQQGKDVEAAIARLAQKARAAGMHVVLATQRPSVDVITGMIKANFPTRIAYRVAQKVDSRTILDEMGAELLLGRGDMLVKLNGSSDTHRVQCPFISEEEVSALTDHLRAQGSPVYNDDILSGSDDEESPGESEDALDSRYDEAVRIVAETQRCSTSWLQRKMTIGYNRAAKIVESMEARAVIGPPNGSKEREIFVHPQ